MTKTSNEKRRQAIPEYAGGGESPAYSGIAWRGPVL